VPIRCLGYVETLYSSYRQLDSNAFCLWNSAPPLSMASLTAFDHAVTRFTPLSEHSYVILEVRVVHCRHSGGRCRAFLAWESARSLRGSPRCVLTLTMNVRAPRITRSLTHSTIVVMMSAFASSASVVLGPLPIHHDNLLEGCLTVAQVEQVNPWRCGL
jgi:hypothetical protein